MNIFKKSLVAAVATGVILTSTGIGMGAVSYTHLTLPTNREV